MDPETNTEAVIDSKLQKLVVNVLNTCVKYCMTVPEWEYTDKSAYKNNKDGKVEFIRDCILAYREKQLEAIQQSSQKD